MNTASTFRNPVESFLKRSEDLGRRRGQRKGHLRIEHSSWLLTYRVYDVSGRGHRETVTIGPGTGPGKLTAKQAERFAWDHYLSKVDQIAQQPRALMSIGEFWEKHFKPGAHMRLKKTTREQYFSLYDRWIAPYLSRKRLATIEPSDVEAVVARAIESGKSTATAKHIRKVISAIYTRAKKLRIASGDNPASLADVPEIKPVRLKFALTVSQMSAVLRMLDEPERTMALTAVLTSMNVSELCGLQWKHVNLSEEWTSVDGEGIKPLSMSVRQHFSRGEFGSLKTGNRRRDIPMPPPLSEALVLLKQRSRFIGPDDSVFASSSGRPISENNTRKRKLAPIAKTLGISRLSWHVFRYSHATFTEAVGMPAKDRQAILGHGSMSQTSAYTIADEERMRAGLNKVAGMILGSGERVQ